jgi:hypothetical protein
VSIRRTPMTAGAVTAWTAIPASAPAKATGRGRFCQGESKTHGAGTWGTPHSVCGSGAERRLKTQATTRSHGHNPHIALVASRRS